VKGKRAGARRGAAQRVPAGHREAPERPVTERQEFRSALPAGVETAHAIGIMTGTSADGIDVALTRITDAGSRHRSSLAAFATRAFDDATRAAILEAQEGTLTTRPLVTLAARLPALAAEVAKEALDSPGAAGARVEVIGFHGQTVFHDPKGARTGV